VCDQGLALLHQWPPWLCCIRPEPGRVRVGWGAWRLRPSDGVLREEDVVELVAPHPLPARRRSPLGPARTRPQSQMPRMAANLILKRSEGVRGSGGLRDPTAITVSSTKLPPAIRGASLVPCSIGWQPGAAVASVWRFRLHAYAAGRGLARLQYGRVGCFLWSWLRRSFRDCRPATSGLRSR
jgi:hypothetical protein